MGVESKKEVRKSKFDFVIKSSKSDFTRVDMLPKVTPLKTAKPAAAKKETPQVQANAIQVKPEQDPCVVCKSDVYLNPSLRFLVSPCYHRLCENCVQRIFVAGLAPCPICKMSLRLAQWKVPLFEDLSVERECQIRRRVMAIFNRLPDDFDTPRDYDDWLEQVEDIIWRLVAMDDVQACEAQLESYRQTNLRLVEENRRREQQEMAVEAEAEHAEQDRRRMASQLTDQDRREEAQQRQQREIDLVESLLTTKTKKKRASANPPSFDPLAGVDPMPTLNTVAKLPASEEAFLQSARCRAAGVNPMEVLTFLVSEYLSIKNI